MRDRRRLGRLALVLGVATAIGACTSGPGPPTPSVAPGGGSELATNLPSSAPGTVTPTAGPTVSPPPRPSPSPTPSPPLALGSSAFTNGAAIPARYTCLGADGSPPLAWSHAPAGTAAFALVVVDMDASGFAHWVLSDIPADRVALAAGAWAGVRGRNGFGGVGYGGPCPPVGSGPHHYVFTFSALSHALGLRGVPTAAQVRTAAARVTLATARLMATFRR